MKKKERELKRERVKVYSSVSLEILLMEGALRSYVDVENLNLTYSVDFDKHKPAYSKQYPMIIIYIAEREASCIKT